MTHVGPILHTLITEVDFQHEHIQTRTKDVARPC